MAASAMRSSLSKPRCVLRSRRFLSQPPPHQQQPHAAGISGSSLQTPLLLVAGVAAAYGFVHYTYRALLHRISLVSLVSLLSPAWILLLTVPSRIKLLAVSEAILGSTSQPAKEHTNNAANKDDLQHPTTAPVDPSKPRPIVLCGPSGTGKSTLLKRLFKEYPDNFGFSISHTSRKPRAGETNGVEYHFTERAQLLSLIADGQFVESAEFSGNIYGTSYKAVQDVLAQGRNVVLDIDMQGVIQLQTKVASGTLPFSNPPLYVFIAPPSMEVLEKRLMGRGTESPESAAKRLDAAKRELAWGLKPGSVDVIIVNDDLEKAYHDLRKAILG
eukprot:jgi/Hompol1/5878/HPOL_000177-RA